MIHIDNTHDVILTVGDWSRDGHNQFDQFRFRCNKNRKKVEAAYKTGAQMIGFDLTKYCTDYEDSHIPTAEIQKLSDAGARLPKWGEENSTNLMEDLDLYDLRDDSFSVETELYAELYMAIAQVGDPDFVWQLVPTNFENEIHIGG